MKAGQGGMQGQINVLYALLNMKTVIAVSLRLGCMKQNEARASRVDDC